MNIELEFVRRLVQSLLIQLGDEAPDWHLAQIGYLQIGDVLDEDELTNNIEARLESLSGDYSPILLNFTVNAPLNYAVLEVAGQIESQAQEATHGGATPPCPGHQHPATADLVEEVPQWVCMQEGAAYYAADILPNFDLEQTLEQYMKANSA